jgi:hypothetical protein
MGPIARARLIQFFLLSGFIIGCGGVVQTVDISQRTRVYKADYPTVARAIVDYCNEAGFPVSGADKESARIRTDYKVNEGMGMPILVPSRARMSFSLERLSDSETKVVSEVSIEKQVGTDWNQVEISEGPARDVYYEILNGIQHQLSK